MITKKMKIYLGLALLIAVIIAGLIICDTTVSSGAKDSSYSNVDSIPRRKVGLVLGTSPISTWTGRRNRYFDNRITAAAELYKAGKIDWLIVSGGDYRATEEDGFDEPKAMRDSLMKHGVDSLRIILDYDGTRTLNSIAKIHDIYHQDSVIIISQEYHNARALYQAKHLGIHAIAFDAGTPVGMSSLIWWRNRGRETLARVKAVLEMAKVEKIAYNDTIDVLSARIAYRDSCWDPLFRCYMRFPSEYYFGIPKGEEKYQGRPMIGHFFSTDRLDSLWTDTNDEELSWGWWGDNSRKVKRKIYLCSSNPQCPRVTLVRDASNDLWFDIMWEGDLDGDGITDFGLYPNGRGFSQWNSYWIMTFHNGKLYELIDYTPMTDFEFRASGLEVAEPGSKKGYVKINCAGDQANERKEFPRKLIPFS